MKPLLLRPLAICVPILAVLLTAAPTAFAGAGAETDDAADAATATETTDGEPDAAMLEAGRLVFTEEAAPACTVCHTLADAGSSGQIGPNLDELQPTKERVVQAVSGGVGVMPAYGDQLSDEQIDAVALYVSTVAGDS